MNPPLTVILGPARSGKTTACLDRYREAEGNAWLAVPSKQHADRIRSLLTDSGSSTKGRIASFGDLTRRLAGISSPEDDAGLIKPTFRRLAHTEVFSREVGAEGYFAAMHGAPGFIAALGEAIAELKLSGITPDDLENAASSAAGALDDPSFALKAGEIARMLRAYDQFLGEHLLRDEEDLVRIATEKVLRGANIEPSLILVDGFFRLSRAWRGLVAALAKRGIEVVVTLPFDSDRPLLFATPARTLESLKREFEVQEEYLSRSPAPTRPGPLDMLERHLFAPPASKHAIRNTQHLTIFNAPDPYAEVEMVIRAIRREHDERGTEWDRCAIILRTPGDYLPILESVAARFSVPLMIEQPRALTDCPIVKPLETLFRVFLGGWQRDDVIGFLKSSYSGVDKLSVESLRCRSRIEGVREGASAWRKLAETLTSVVDRMIVWDSRLAAAPRRPSAFADDIIRLSGEFGFEGRCNEGTTDAAALNRAMEAVRELAGAAEAVGRGETTFRGFHASIAAAWRATTIPPGTSTGRVIVLEPYDAGQIDPAFVAIMGLTERSFPRQVNEDPFFRDDEREALGAAGIELEPRNERADDERLLFYLSAAAPSKRLILSYPRTTTEKDTQRSFYLDEVHAIFDDVPAEMKTLADVAPRPDECVTPHDRLLSACAAAPDEIAPEDIRTEIEDLRGSKNLPPLPRLRDESLRGAYSAPHRYNVSELETYNTCPFQHFMKYGLRVRPDPEGGGLSDRGGLYHEALRRLFRRLGADASLLEEERLREEALTELRACLESRNIDAPPHRRRMLERFLVEALTGFAKRETLYTQKFGLRPTYFELAFGMDSGGHEDESRDYDPASSPRALVIQKEDGGSIQLCGAIDRVDLTPDGRKALVMDYKTGNTVDYKQMQEGKSLQMPLYMLALEQVWGKIAAVGCYDSPRDTGRRRIFRTEHVELNRFRFIPGADADTVKPVSQDEHNDTVQMAQQQAIRAVRNISQADILPTPGDHCRYCDYGDCCRTGLDNVHDGEPFDIMTEDATQGVQLQSSESEGLRS